MAKKTEYKKKKKRNVSRWLRPIDALDGLSAKEYIAANYTVLTDVELTENLNIAGFETSAMTLTKQRQSYGFAKDTGCRKIAPKLVESSGVRAMEEPDESEVISKAVQEWRRMREIEERRQTQYLRFEEGVVALACVGDLHAGGGGMGLTFNGR